MGSLFVELVNPWSGEGARPPELCRYPNGLPHMDMSGRDPVPYRDPRTNAVGEGVLLHRQSDALGPAGQQTGPSPVLGRSPVWRMAIVRQRTPELLKKYEKYQVEVADGLMGSWERAKAANKDRDFRTLNPDQLTFDSDRDADRWVYFSTAPPKVNYSHYDRVNNRWTFVSRTQDTNSTTQLRIPSAPMSSAAPFSTPRALGSQYFLASDVGPGSVPSDAANPTGTILAPVMPGCYAIVGSSGTQYTQNAYATATDGTKTPRFITTFGRIMPPVDRANYQADREHATRLDRIRRIELMPKRNPYLHQILVAKNGGSEFVDINGQLINMTDKVNVEPNIKACVAIPIEGLNVTEPAGGYIDDQGNSYPGYIDPRGDGDDIKRQAVRNAVGEWEFRRRSRALTHVRKMPAR